MLKYQPNKISAFNASSLPIAASTVTIPKRDMGSIIGHNIFLGNHASVQISREVFYRRQARPTYGQSTTHCFGMASATPDFVLLNLLLFASSRLSVLQSTIESCRLLNHTFPVNGYLGALRSYVTPVRQYRKLYYRNP